MEDAGILLAIILPIVILVSFRGDFSDYYPISRLARTGAQWFFIWEVIQLLYFFGWEFLNRGILVLELENTMGRWSIVAAAAPFCILHFGEPGLETFASFFVAIALGWLTLRRARRLYLQQQSIGHGLSRLTLLSYFERATSCFSD